MKLNDKLITMTKYTNENVLAENRMIPDKTCFIHPSILSWTLTCVSAVLSYVFKNLYCKYRDILKEVDFVKVELLKTSNEIKILSAKMDSSIDNLRTIISYIERDLHK